MSGRARLRASATVGGTPAKEAEEDARFIIEGGPALDDPAGIMNSIATLRAHANALATRAARGEDLLVGAIADARASLDLAATHYGNWEPEAAREALQLAQEQLDTAEQRAPS